MDEGTVRRIQEGDRAAFAQLIVEQHRRLFTLAHGILRDVHAAEDATQQAFLDIWRDVRDLRDPSRFEAWSYRIVVRVCRREMQRRRAGMSALESQRIAPAAGSDAYATIVDRDRLERAFARLSVDQRTVVAMRFLLDMEPERIAETLGIPRRTVYSRLRRGLAGLRAAVDADERIRLPAIDGPEAVR